MGDESWLKGRRVWVLASGVDMTTGLSAGLAEQGAAVVLVADDAATLDAAPAGIERASAEFSTQDAADAVAHRIHAIAGAPDLVVISITPPEAGQVRPLMEMSPADWRAATSDGLKTLMHMLRALGPQLKARPAAVVIVGASLSLVGCPDMVALSTVLEGQRGMMKSVARQWGGTGVTLNWIAAAPRALSPIFDDAILATKPDAVTVALGRPLDPKTEIAPIVGFLGSTAGRAITGATLTLDGGEWMVP
jgi:3-oxoacyl-[acyl-carrier protein] reductase